MESSRSKKTFIFGLQRGTHLQDESRMSDTRISLDISSSFFAKKLSTYKKIIRNHNALKRGLLEMMSLMSLQISIFFFPSIFYISRTSEQSNRTAMFMANMLFIG